MEVCQKCGGHLIPGERFCASCKEYRGSAKSGSKAAVPTRFIALLIDSFLSFCVGAVPMILLKSSSPRLGLTCSGLLSLGYLVWYLTLLRKGVTPGKLVMGLRVVDIETGNAPGFLRMLLRETIGRFLSTLLLGLGYWWAIFDKNGQTWHDKLASTVVIVPAKQPVQLAAAA